MSQDNNGALISGGQYRGYLIMCGLTMPHDPHLHGVTDDKEGWPSLERICPGDGALFDLHFRKHPQGGLYAIEAVSNYPVVFTYMSQRDAERYFPRRMRKRTRKP